MCKAELQTGGGSAGGKPSLATAARHAREHHLGVKRPREDDDETTLMDDDQQIPGEWLER